MNPAFERGFLLLVDRSLVELRHTYAATTSDQDAEYNLGSIDNNGLQGKLRQTKLPVITGEGGTSVPPLRWPRHDRWASIPQGG